MPGKCAGASSFSTLFCREDGWIEKAGKAERNRKKGRVEVRLIFTSIVTLLQVLHKLSYSIGWPMEEGNSSMGIASEPYSSYVLEQ